MMMYRRLFIPAAGGQTGWSCRKMSGNSRMEVCMKVFLTGVLAVVGTAVAVVPAPAHGERVCREVNGFLEQF